MPLKTPQERTGRCPTGITYSGEGRVLIRNNASALIWFAGGTSYVDRVVGSTYGKATLVILRKNAGMARMAETLHEGGGLKSVPWNTNPIWQKLNEEFGGIDLTNLRDVFDGSATLDLTGDPPWFRVISQEEITRKEENSKRNKIEREKIKERQKARRNLPLRRDFTESELESIVTRFENDNEERLRLIADKAKVMLQHLRLSGET